MPNDTISCDKNDLAQASKCFCYPDRVISDAVVIYLLKTIAENTETAAEMAKSAACFCYPDSKSRDAVILYLLCAISEKVGA